MEIKQKSGRRRVDWGWLSPTVVAQRKKNAEARQTLRGLLRLLARMGGSLLLDNMEIEVLKETPVPLGHMWDVRVTRLGEMKKGA